MFLCLSSALRTVRVSYTSYEFSIYVLISQSFDLIKTCKTSQYGSDKHAPVIDSFGVCSCYYLHETVMSAVQNAQITWKIMRFLLHSQVNRFPWASIRISAPPFSKCFNKKNTKLKINFKNDEIDKVDLTDVSFAIFIYQWDIKEYIGKSHLNRPTFCSHIVTYLADNSFRS